MKYRAKIYLHNGMYITSRETFDFDAADWMRANLMSDIEQATGGHIEKYVDGIGWVVSEESEANNDMDN